MTVQRDKKMSFICYWDVKRCDGCGDKHKDCEKWDGVMKQAALEAEQTRQEEVQRMSCGKCDKCNAEGVRLNPHGVWDMCDKCSKTIQKAKKSKK
jgi:hypothetical protein